MTGPLRVEAARIDCHVHTRRSPDGRGTYKEVVAQARRKGLHGLVLTDHNSFPDGAELHAARVLDFLLIPGMEVSTKAGHCLAIGIQNPVLPGRSLPDTIDAIKKAGGAAVPSHPFRWVHGVGRGGLDGAHRDLQAIEVFNASDGNGFRNFRAAGYSKHLGLGGTGGSDAHLVVEVGNAYTAFPTWPDSIEDVVAQIEKRATWGEGRGTPRYLVAWRQLRSLGFWIRRGFQPL